MAKGSPSCTCDEHLQIKKENPPREKRAGDRQRHFKENQKWAIHAQESQPLGSQSGESKQKRPSRPGRRARADVARARGRHEGSRGRRRPTAGQVGRGLKAPQDRGSGWGDRVGGGSPISILFPFSNDSQNLLGFSMALPASDPPWSGALWGEGRAGRGLEGGGHSEQGPTEPPLGPPRGWGPLREAEVDGWDHHRALLGPCPPSASQPVASVPTDPRAATSLNRTVACRPRLYSSTVQRAQP